GIAGPAAVPYAAPTRWSASRITPAVWGRRPGGMQSQIGKPLRAWKRSSAERRDRRPARRWTPRTHTTDGRRRCAAPRPEPERAALGRRDRTVRDCEANQREAWPAE